jgi:hypothetical protein
LLNETMSRNYVNGMPSSVVRYGHKRSHYETYDGVLNSTGDRSVDRSAALQDRVKYLQAKLNDLLALASQNLTQDLVHDTTVITNLVYPKVTIKQVLSSDHGEFTGTKDSTHLSIQPAALNQSLIMNGCPLFLKDAGNVKTMITGSEYSPGRGFCEVRGEIGGGLSHWNGERRICMDWGDERIRSPRTFQSGTVYQNLQDPYTVTSPTTQFYIAFPFPFKTTPVVILHDLTTAEHITNNFWMLKNINTGAFTFQAGHIVHFLKLINVTASGFTFQLYTLAINTSTNERRLRLQPYKGDTDKFPEQGFSPAQGYAHFHWMAMDKTTTDGTTTATIFI